MVNRMNTAPEASPRLLAAAVAGILAASTPALADSEYTPVPPLKPYAQGTRAYEADGTFIPPVRDFANRVLRPIADTSPERKYYHSQIRAAFAALPQPLQLELDHLLVDMAQDPQKYDEAQFLRNLYPLMIWLSGSFEAANQDVEYAKKAFELLATANGKPMTQEALLAAWKDETGSAWGLGQGNTILALYNIAVEAGRGEQFVAEWQAALKELKVLNPTEE